MSEDKKPTETKALVGKVVSDGENYAKTEYMTSVDKFDPKEELDRLSDLYDAIYPVASMGDAAAAATLLNISRRREEVTASLHATESFSARVKSGREQALEALRDDLADRIEKTSSSRDAAALINKLLSVIDSLGEIEAGNQKSEPEPSQSSKKDVTDIASYINKRRARG